MQVIKKINNNVALCVDENGNELIAYSKGIGFNKQIPYEISDLAVINKTFYHVNSEYITLLNEMPDNILEDSLKIVDYISKQLSGKVNKNIFFTIADHINFAISRAKKGVYIKNSLMFITQVDYPDEMKIATKIIKWLNKKYSINFPNDEACYIAFHILNAEETTENKNQKANLGIVEACKEIIEKNFNIKIDDTSFFYSRFVLHIKNLISRRNETSTVIVDNEKLFETMKEQCTDSYKCSLIIKEMIKNKMDFDLSNEEMVYLMLHINQLKNREESKNVGMGTTLNKKG